MTKIASLQTSMPLTIFGTLSQLLNEAGFCRSSATEASNHYIFLSQDTEKVIHNIPCSLQKKKKCDLLLIRIAFAFSEKSETLRAS